MEKLYEEIRKDLSADKNYEYTKWLTEHYPRRISGMGDDRKAAEWVASKFKEFGLESEVINFEAYNSNPISSSLKVIQPELKEIDSLPCCHVESTPKEGIDVELVYVGAGDYDDYIEKDVKGKAVLGSRQVILGFL